MRNILVGLLCSAMLCAEAQPTTLWQRTIGGAENDECRDAVSTSDGGFLVVGSTQSKEGFSNQPHGKSDVLLVKLSANGEPQWQKVFGGSENDYAHWLLPSAGGHLMVGSTRSSDGDAAGTQAEGTNAWLVLFSESGNIIWQKQYGGAGNDALYAAVRLPNGNIALTGQKSNVSGSDAEVWVLLIDAQGKLLAEKTFGGSSFDRANDIIATRDGGFLITGQTYSNDRDVTANQGGGDFWVLKLSATLQLEWQRSVGAAGMDIANGAVQLADGCYLVAGNSQGVEKGKSAFEGEIDGLIVKLSPAGAVVYERRLGGKDHEMLGKLVATRTGGGFLVAGWYGEGRADMDMRAWVAELNVDGDIRWQHKLAGDGGGSFNSVLEMGTGELLLVGWTRAERTGKNQAWMVRFGKSVRLQGLVTDSLSGKPVSAELSFTPFGSATPIKVEASTEGYTQQLPPGKCLLTVRKAGYRDTQLVIDIPANANQYKQPNINLSPIRKGERVTLKNIYFERQSTTLTIESYPELDKVAAFLMERNTVQIRIEGHTAGGGQEPQNVALSLQRAVSVREYLLKKGIAPNRIEVQGLGSSRPTCSEDTESCRSRNRRIEFVVISE